MQLEALKASKSNTPLQKSMYTFNYLTNNDPNSQFHELIVLGSKEFLLRTISKAFIMPNKYKIPTLRK